MTTTHVVVTANGGGGESPARRHKKHKRHKRRDDKSCGAAWWLGRLAHIISVALTVVLVNTLMDHDAHFSILDDIDALHHKAVVVANSSSSTTARVAQVSAARRAQQAPTAVDDPVVIGYAVTVTRCNERFQIEDTAAVMRYAIHRQSVRMKSADGSPVGRYDYHFYAIYHPNATQCVQPLQELGYTLLERETPVNVSEIQCALLRERLPTNGCCGEKELLKFEAFLLTQHPVIVLLDLDVVIVKPLDDLFDLILHGADKTQQPPRHWRHVQWPDRRIPDDVRLLFSIDYAMVNPERKVKPAQGGFTIFKPNRQVYNDIVNIVLQGHYGIQGWENRTGKFWGGMTFQGLIPYYFLVLQGGRHAVELNWCVHNNMAAEPREDNETAIRKKRSPRCLTDTDTCQDCREMNYSDVYSFHFTNCLKPFQCIGFIRDQTPFRKTCRHFNMEWYHIRSELEQSWGRSGIGKGRFDNQTFHGYCRAQGIKGYMRIAQPYGVPVGAAHLGRLSAGGVGALKPSVGG